MPASSVGAEHMERFQIKTGTGRDDKNPSASDSVGVHHHRLARGKSTTLWWVAWSYGICVCTDNPQAHKTCRNQSKAASTSAMLRYSKQNTTCQHQLHCIYLTCCSVKYQPSELCFSLATGRPRGFATPFLTCSKKQNKKRWFFAFYWGLSLKRQSTGNWVDSARNKSATNSQGRAAFVISEACTHVWSKKQTPQQKESICCMSVMQDKCLDRKLNCSILGMSLAATRAWLMKVEIRTWSHHTQKRTNIVWLHYLFSDILRCSKHCSGGLHWHFQLFILSRFYINIIAIKMWSKTTFDTN